MSGPTLTPADLDSLRQQIEVDPDDLTDEQVTHLLAALDLAGEALNLRPPVEGEDLLDVRQRRAAAIILCSIDLPAEMGAWARQVGAAAALLPGLTTGDVALGSRAAGLRLAQGLIAEMLSESGE